MKRSGTGTWVGVALLIGTLAPTIHATDRRGSAGLESAAGSGGRMEAVALPEASAVKLDGEFSESAWGLATPVTEFLQREPAEGKAPSQLTEARVLYDATHLYVAVRAFDTDPGKIVAIKHRRDGESPSDLVAVFVDSYHDKRTAYGFFVNAAGVKKDTYYFSDGNEDTSWDAVWDVSVTRDDKGWKAEFRIPFSQLRFDPARGEVFGFAIARQIGRLSEVSTWPLLARSKTGLVSQFGELGGLKLSRGGKRLELAPYLVGQGQTQPVEAGNPFVTSRKGSGAFGADVKFALTPGLTLIGTVNPDFGQVEADPAVVNLTAFETFYQERRPFFVEGSGNMRFDLDCNDGACTGLFYSRRIGRRPRGYPDVPDGGFASVPSQTTILGAAKLTGRVGSFAIGGLSAVTSEEMGDVALGSQRWSESVEPLSNYTLAQAKREFANSSTLGFMFTNTARRLNDELGFLPSGATTGGVNWDWRLRNKTYSVSGYLAGSHVRGKAEAIQALQGSSVHNYQRPDAGHVDYDATRTSLSGQAGSLAFSKIGGQRVRFNFNGSFKTPGFDVNDVGYVRRADDISQSSWVQFRWETPTKLYRSARVNLNQWSMWNFDGDRRNLGTNVNAHITLTSNWSAGTGMNVNSSGIDDRATRGGPAMRSMRGGNVWYYVETDERKPINGMLMGYVWRGQEGASEYGFDPRVVWRPTSSLTLTGGLSFSKDNNPSQWVTNLEDATGTHYLFGQIRQTTLGLTTRVNYTITPNLTVQLYAQPFVSTGAYTDFKELVRPRANRYGDQFAPASYGGDPDFTYRSLRMTNVLRWEYRPGSALYVVWQQGREGSGDMGRFNFRRDFGGVFSTPSSNVFLVKFSYWLNL